MIPSIKLFENYLGSYIGTGVNHEGQNFAASFSLNRLYSGFEISYVASSVDGKNTLFHSEKSIITNNHNGKLALFNFNSNTPFMVEHELVEGSDHHCMVFRYGQLEDTSSFREEIYFYLLGHKIRYDYHWALPGGEFKFRSGLELTKVQNHLSLEN